MDEMIVLGIVAILAVVGVAAMVLGRNLRFSASQNKVVVEIEGEPRSDGQAHTSDHRYTCAGHGGGI